MYRFMFCLSLALVVVNQHILIAAEIAKLVLTSPQPYQVVQREGFELAKSHAHRLVGAEIGYADVKVRGTKPQGLDGTFEFRIVALKAAFGIGSEWLAMEVEQNGQEFQGLAEVGAGGWYRLEVRCTHDGKVVAEGSVEPFGVGEIFVIAGQSYAAGANDELMTVTEPQQRVAAFDPVGRTWRVANDPQPGVGDGGTIWPPLGDMLVPILRVPIGFVNVSVGATSSRQWMPEEGLHKKMVAAGKAVGAFRSVLWQQGESDVIEKTATEAYVKNLIRIREAAAREWKFEPTWLLAKSTFHPTVYNDPAGEDRIRAAIQQLWKRPHFAPGPDTDLLTGESRGDVNSNRHFTGPGQRRAALLWFTAIWNELDKPLR